MAWAARRDLSHQHTRMLQPKGARRRAVSEGGPQAAQRLQGRRREQHKETRDSVAAETPESMQHVTLPAEVLC